MQLLEAQVKYPGRVYNTKFGERLNAVFISPSGEEITVWGPEVALYKGYPCMWIPLEFVKK